MPYIRSYVPAICALYAENDCTSERLIKTPNALQAFTNELNSRKGTNFRAEDVAGELERIRKDKAGTGGLPKLGRRSSGPNFI